MVQAHGNVVATGLFPVSGVLLRFLCLVALLAALIPGILAEDDAAAAQDGAKDSRANVVEMILVLRHDEAGGQPWMAHAVVVDAAPGGPESDAVIQIYVDDADLIPTPEQRVVQVHAVHEEEQRWRVAGLLRPWSASGARPPTVDVAQRYRQQLAEALLAQSIPPIVDVSEERASAGSYDAGFEADSAPVVRPRPRADQALAAVLIDTEPALVEYHGRLRVGQALLLLNDASADLAEVEVTAVDGRFAIIRHIPEGLQHLRLRQARLETEEERE